MNCQAESAAEDRTFLNRAPSSRLWGDFQVTLCPQRDLRVQDDFAELLALFEQLVGVGALRQREGAVDHGAQLALPDQLQYGIELGPAAHIRAQDGQLAAEQVAEVELGLVAS